MTKRTPQKRTNEQYDLRILKSLRQIIRAVDIHSRKLSVEYQITAPQLIVLLSIGESSPVTLNHLSQIVHVSSSTLVGVIDRLESKGFVKRERSTEDRRQVNIKITSEGERFVKSAPSPLQEKLAESLLELSPVEQSAIALSLERIVELMRIQEPLENPAPVLEAGIIDSTTLKN